MTGLEMPNDKGVVTFTLGADRIADHLACATHFHDRMRVGIVRSYSLYINLGSRIDNQFDMLAEAIPICLAVLIIDVALIPDSH